MALPVRGLRAGDQVDLKRVAHGRRRLRPGRARRPDEHRYRAADAIAEYRKHLDEQSALVFCVTIEHSRATARALRTAGINAVHLDGDTPAGERRDIIARLGGAEPLIVCNCGIIAEGLNVPVVGGVILLRPTKSLALYLQQIGRALRPAPGKQRAVILDHAGNVYRHGFPDLEHAWSLAGRPKKRGQAPVKRCSSCGALIPTSARECPECGAIQPRPAASPGHAVSRPLLELDAMTAHERWLATGSFKSVIEVGGPRRSALARGRSSSRLQKRLGLLPTQGAARSSGERAAKSHRVLGESLKNPRAAAGAYHGRVCGD